ncbi:MAG: DUF433 domain-containing protein [Candidatus Gracilibacteria bacterium]
MATSKISVSSTVLFGKPCITGTRVAVEQILACLSEGWTHSKIKKEFGISEEDIKACMDFAYRSVSRTHFVNTSGKAYV